MKTSPTIKELGIALAKAQGKIKTAEFDKTNPHFKRKYASLTSVWAACREALSGEGLSVVQGFKDLPEGPVCVTMLIHNSGEWIEFESAMVLEKQTMQGFGSAATYARRYGLSAIVGVVADEDDDGEAASNIPGRASEIQRQVEETATNTPPQFENSEAFKQQPAAEGGLGDFKITFGRKFNGKQIKDIKKGDLKDYIEWLDGQPDKHPNVVAAIEKIKQFLEAA